MKKLFVVRHAKSCWQNDKLSDMDRPLKGRGVTDAHGTATWLMENGTEPECIISSPAVRALHTAMIFARTFSIDFSAIRIEPGLYENGTTAYLKSAQQIDDAFSVAMIFGHNPSITSFINQCVDNAVSHVPTTGVACLSFAVDSWKDIPSGAKLIFFDYPKRRKTDK